MSIPFENIVPDLSLLSKRIPSNPSIGSTTVSHPDHVHLSFGFAAPDLFPIQALESAAERAITGTHGRQALQYSGAPGPRHIIEWISERAQVHGIQADPQHILVTYGATQGISLAAQLLLEPDDEVWVEAPTFFSALQSFRIEQASIRAFPIDSDGVDVEQIEQALIEARNHGQKIPKLFYIMPTYHNPGGVTLSLARREKLAQLAQEYNFYLLEDDAYAELNFTGQTLPTLYSLAPERTIYLNTFSKIIAPGVRLGWLIAHPLLVEQLRILMLGSSVGVFTQEILAQLLIELPFEEHLQQLIGHYRRQRDVMVEAIEYHLGNEVTYDLPEGGFFLWLTFADEVDTTILQQIAAERGVGFVDGRSFYHDGSGQQHARLCFSYCNEEQIRNGIERLADAYKQYTASFQEESNHLLA